jgi:uncharacterized membrane protein
MSILYLIFEIIVIIFSVLTTALIIMFIVFIVIYSLTSKEHIHKKLFHLTHPEKDINIHQRYANGEISKRDYLKIKHDKYSS